MEKLNSLNIVTYKKLDYRISDIASQKDKILIRLGNGSVIHLPLDTLNKEEIQSLKRRPIEASSEGKNIVFSEIPSARGNIDYFVSIEWMRYDGKWLPREINFKPTFPERTTRCVRVIKESLTNFTYQDVIKSLEAFPWLEAELHETSYVNINHMSSYLGGDFYNIINDDPWPPVIAARDSATFLYLEPIMNCPVILTESGHDVHTLVKKYNGSSLWN